MYLVRPNNRLQMQKIRVCHNGHTLIFLPKIEKMKHCIDIDKKTYYDKIRQNDCQYVHEVQHFLREEAGEDRLRLHHDIRN